MLYNNIIQDRKQESAHSSHATTTFIERDIVERAHIFDEMPKLTSATSVARNRCDMVAIDSVNNPLYIKPHTIDRSLSLSIILKIIIKLVFCNGGPVEWTTCEPLVLQLNPVALGRAFRTCSNKTNKVRD